MVAEKSERQQREAKAKAEADGSKEKEETEKKPVVVQLTVPQELRANLSLLNRAIESIEPRYSARVLRSLTTLRKKLYQEALRDVVEERYAKSSPTLPILLSHISNLPTQKTKSPPTLPDLKPENIMDIDPSTAASAITNTATTALSTASDAATSAMDVVSSTVSGAAGAVGSVLGAVGSLVGAKSGEERESAETDSGKEGEKAEKVKEKKVEQREILPEQDVYLRLLVVLGLIDAGRLDDAHSLAHQILQHTTSLSRRTMDHLAAKVWFYYARIVELRGEGAEKGKMGQDEMAGLRSLLLQAHSTASLRHDEDLQATLLNLLLRNYFNASLFDQADKLISKTTFPESAGNAQLARYLFYLGRIRAVQLNYTESHTHLQHAIRRAPNPNTAPGFYQTVHKYFIVVELLMGDIPERAIFRRPVLRKALAPYFQIVQAVRVGELEAFQAALTTHTAKFIADGTHSLIVRLRHNVIKTALRMISLAYSRISLKDICLKLHLDSEEDTEYIVAKAIRDGVIDAEIDHKNGWMKSKEAGNVYETDEPQKAFQRRIDFCMTLHNDSVKAMRYPLTAAKPEVEDSELQRERMLDIEAALAEADGDDDMEM